MNLVEGRESDNPKLKFAPLALSDIKETWQYISEQSEDAAKRVVREIIKKCELLSKNPKIGHERNDLIIDLRLFPYKNYNIYYFLLPTTVLKSTASCIVRETLSKYSMT